MKIKIACISDIHLGHHRNKAVDIIRSLDDNFLGNPDLKNVDIIFMAGDLFDRLLEPTSEDKPIIYLWFIRLCKFCSNNDITLRILEGTPSHDWKQSEILPTIKQISNLNVDLKYVKTLSIEFIEKFNCNVLYIPDEWRPDPTETLQEVKELLKARGLETVEFGVFHGNFEYQLPSAAKGIPRHSSEEYLKLVTELIFIGHIHTYSRFERIVAQGSFDRLSHGEEEAKGFVLADVDIGNNKRDVFFIENKDARVYKTINCIGKSLEETITFVKDFIKHLPGNSAIRIMAESDNPVFTNMDILLRLCPTMVWSKKPITEDQTDVTKEFDTVDDEIYKPITITKENLSHLLLSRQAFKEMSQDIIQRSIQHLKEVL